MTPNIPGADSIVSWFGRWPSFHDAEIMTLHVSSLLVEQTNDGYRLVVGPCYGMAGEIIVKDLKVRLEPTLQPVN